MTTRPAVLPSVKGWCPGAHRPMMSGDGLVVRIRPWGGRMKAEALLGLSDLAAQFGSGVIDLTRRANLQIRGVREADHEALLQELSALGLLDPEPTIEARRNILVTPNWETGDLTTRLVERLTDALGDLPDLPAKTGFAVDTGPAPMLTRDPADIRVEHDAAGGLLLRADSAEAGRPVNEATVMPALLEMVHWFVAHIRPDARRMKSVLAQAQLPAAWLAVPPAPTAPRPVPGQTDLGAFYGVPLGQVDAAALRGLIADANPTHVRFTPWRMILLEGAEIVAREDFITTVGDPILQVDACPGAPLCPSASVATRDIARSLAPLAKGGLHVSGCAKGCARSAPAAVTLVGRDGRFDLVRHGHPWDEPQRVGLGPEDLDRLMT